MSTRRRTALFPPYWFPGTGSAQRDRHLVLDRRALEALADKFPTAAIAVLRFEGDWADLRGVRAALEAFSVPRG